MRGTGMTILTHRTGMTARAYLADLWFRLVPFTIMQRSTAYDREHNAFVLGLDAGAAGYRALPDGKVAR